jgi:putative ABC transport system permease protein
VKELKTAVSSTFKDTLMQRLSFNLKLAIEAVIANPLRAVLTGLGIMFGVGAVIAMLAIGTGAKESILAQMKLIGTNNVLVEAVMPSERTESVQGDGEKKLRWSPGITLSDLAAIRKSIPSVESISSEVVYPLPIIYNGRLERSRVVGIEPSFFAVNNIDLGLGRTFHYSEEESGRPVCIVGANLVKTFFPDGDPLGKLIKCGQVWLRVVGVLETRSVNRNETLGIKDRNNDIYIPTATALLYFGNRARITATQIGEDDDNDDEPNGPPDNPHQIDRFVVQIGEVNELQASANVLGRLLNRRHRGVEDYTITIPRLLLEQQQRTQETFNLVLASIAGISLLVGGIGIMNIMLASVLERTKEIGVRRSLGATRKDITQQFLSEAAVISLIGGVLGVVIGVGSAKLIASYADIETVVTAWSVLLSFGVAATVGLVFGLLPAQRAAELDPIKALRTD